MHAQHSVESATTTIRAPGARPALAAAAGAVQPLAQDAGIAPWRDGTHLADPPDTGDAHHPHEDDAVQLEIVVNDAQSTHVLLVHGRVVVTGGFAVVAGGRATVVGG